jgi:hypothetical protein
VSWMHNPCSGHVDSSQIWGPASDWTVDLSTSLPSVMFKYLTVILRTRVEYELIADEARRAESAIAHIRRE